MKLILVGLTLGTHMAFLECQLFGEHHVLV